MMKKITVAFTALLLILPFTANAAQLQNKTVAQPTIAIIDTAVDTSLPILKDKIIYEVCLIQWSTCPNGQSIMEGPGSAVLPAGVISKNGFDHGTQMAYLSVIANPNVNIVFIRVIGANRIGLRQATSEATVHNALNWVLNNKDRFNIQAVSMSQGHSNYAAMPEYCPSAPTTETAINALSAAGIPVFFPAGNSGDYFRINWPACIQSSIAIGAVMPNKEIAFYSNFDPARTDFFALGTTRAMIPGGKLVNVAGTSAATAIAATQWATIKSAKPNLTYSQIYELISRTSTPTRNSKVVGGKLINLEAALNG